MLDASHYFDHEADIGVIGRGDTLADAFVDCARAVFAYMADFDEVKPEHSVAIDFTESDPELALVTWLNLLLANARSHGLVFSQFELEQDSDQWRGKAYGSPWAPEQTRGTEVKGATLTMLSVTQSNGKWQAQCVVDV